MIASLLVDAIGVGDSIYAGQFGFFDADRRLARFVAPAADVL
jgi:hypothetical protein